LAQTNPLWRYTANDPVEFFSVSPLGSLVIGTDSSLSSVDGTTGAAMWIRDDIKDLDESNVVLIPNSPFAVVTSRTEFEVIDLNTGARKWDWRSVSTASSYGQVPVVERRMLLVYGKRPNDGSTLLAVDLESGSVLWRQDSLFVAAPEGVGAPRPSTSRKTMLGHQPPVIDSDTSMVLYVSEDGPIKVDLRTGSLLWRADGFRGSEPPAPLRGYAAMVYADGVLYVPSGKRLTAIDLRDGRVLWNRTGLKSKPQQLEWTSSGLVVRIPHIDLLDPQTGASRWPKPFTDLKHSTGFVVRGDKVHVAAHGVFYGINLTDGTASALSQYKLRDADQPDALEMLDNGFAVRTAQTLILLDTAGAPKHHLFYPPPKLSTLTRVAFAAAAVAVSEWSYSAARSAAARTGTMQQYWTVSPILRKRYGASTKAREHYYVLTVLPDTSPRKGPGLVKLNLITGREEGRLWLGDRTPLYEVDPIEGILFFKDGKREIVAFKM
jgi:putative pyrroloquinoline-quinone binding quinoprotein